MNLWTDDNASMMEAFMASADLPAFPWGAAATPPAPADSAPFLRCTGRGRTADNRCCSNRWAAAVAALAGTDRQWRNRNRALRCAAGGTPAAGTGMQCRTRHGRLSRSPGAGWRAPPRRSAHGTSR
jgi:hypothetical protein